MQPRAWHRPAISALARTCSSGEMTSVSPSSGSASSAPSSLASAPTGPSFSSDSRSSFTGTSPRAFFAAAAASRSLLRRASSMTAAAKPPARVTAVAESSCICASPSPGASDLGARLPYAVFSIRRARPRHTSAVHDSDTEMANLRRADRESTGVSAEEAHTRKSAPSAQSRARARVRD